MPGAAGASAGATSGAGAAGATPGGTNGSQGQAGDQSGEQQRQGQGDGANGGQAGDQSGDKGDDGDRAATNARETIARLGKERDEARAEAKQLKEKDLPDAEKQARRVAELEASDLSKTRELAQAKLELAVATRATALGFRDPADAVRLISESDLTRDETGNVTNIEAVLKTLLKTKPYLGGTSGQGGGDGDQGARGGGQDGNKSGDMNKAIRRAAGRGG